MSATGLWMPRGTTEAAFERGPAGLFAIGLLVAAGGAFYALWRRAAARRAGAKPAAA